MSSDVGLCHSAIFPLAGKLSWTQNGLIELAEILAQCLLIGMKSRYCAKRNFKWILFFCKITKMYGCNSCKMTSLVYLFIDYNVIPWKSGKNECDWWRKLNKNGNNEHATLWSECVIQWLAADVLGHSRIGAFRKEILALFIGRLWHFFQTGSQVLQKRNFLNWVNFKWYFSVVGLFRLRIFGIILPISVYLGISKNLHVFIFF